MLPLFRLKRQAGACVARLCRSYDADGKPGWRRYIKALDGAPWTWHFAFALEHRSPMNRREINRL
jgi:hypothetical protein